MTAPDFIGYPKIPRLSRDIVITEKLDGTNAQVFITDDGAMFVGSRSRWITPADDNHGFARWAYDHAEELSELGPGHHYGEWWGCGIQRGYGLTEKRFSLFNVKRWGGPFSARPACCHVVPTLYTGAFTTEAVEEVLDALNAFGSVAAPGFPRPEGIVIYHTGSGWSFKKTLENDEKNKSEIAFAA